MGRVLGSFGVRGWLKVRSFTASPEALLAYRTWWLSKGENRREFGVGEGRKHAEALVVRLDGLDTREDAAFWRGAEIAVPRAVMPPVPSGEVYLSDLIGATVVNRQGATLGRIAELIESAAHPILRVAAVGGEAASKLIPLVPAYIDAIDLAAGRVMVDWPFES